MLPIPIIIGAIFAIWGAADIVSFAATGEDVVYNFASMMGWTGQISGDNVFIEWGMSAHEFLSGYWVFACILIAVVCFTFWASTRPLKPKGGK